MRSLGAPGTIAQPMRESQTNSERCRVPRDIHSKDCRHYLKVHEQSEYPPRMMHRLLFIINFSIILLYSASHQHSIVCIATLRKTKEYGV